ncbi:adenylate cyclase, partial [Candidatus Poribacteria bacterium]|nr:adenylate cyclase [Candidatus Poribacteria bacterium]
ELTGPLPPLAIPATLADSLTARLDRLATVKEVAQLGAVIGREFSYELLSAVSPLDEATLQRELARLVDAEILYPRGLPPQGSYLFKHALIQDAAYQSLLKSRRGQFHTRIAHALEKQFPETVETQPELVAHHYTEAGLIAQAIPYWQKAGQRAIKRSANLEAIGHLRKGLELLKTQPDGPERIQLELALQAALGVPLMAMKGFTAPEVFAAYTRARELCQLVGETPQLFPVLYGVWAFYFIRAELQAARELGEQFVHLTQRQQDSDHLLAAHRVLGAALLCLGELSAARIHFEEVITCYDINKHRSHAFLYGRDPGVDALGQSAWLLWMQGYPNQGKQRSDECLTLAQALDHSHTLAIALTIFPLIHQLRQEEQLTQERAEAAITFSTEQGTPFWRAFGTILHGWALSRRGQGEEGIVQIEKGLAAYRAIGAELLQPYFLGLLAEAYGRVGQAEKGLAALDEALARVEKTGERWWEAELYRLKGELLLMQQRSPIPACGEGLGVGASAEPEADKGSVGASPPQTVEPEAETCFHKALDVTRHQQAKSWELRTAVSLGRLWQRQGKKEEARKMLAEIYGWFTEGFDTADLKEAKALLEELS